MPTYLFSYRNPIGYARTEKSGAAWRAWFDEMGEALVDLGKPAIARTALGNCDSTSTELGGYTLISADDLDAAVAIAKGCPHLQRDGGVEVGLLGDVPGSSIRTASA